jgi:hypothetical protein
MLLSFATGRSLLDRILAAFEFTRSARESPLNALRRSNRHHLASEQSRRQPMSKKKTPRRYIHGRGVPAVGVAADLRKN